MSAPLLPHRLAWIDAFAQHLMQVMPRLNAVRASEIAVRQYEIVGSHDAGDAAAAYALMTAAAREVLGHSADLLAAPVPTARAGLPPEVTEGPAAAPDDAAPPLQTAGVRAPPRAARWLSTLRRA